MVIGLLVTRDGIPIAHHVFAGNTADVSTLPGVLDELQSRLWGAPALRHGPYSASLSVGTPTATIDHRRRQHP